MKIVIFLSINLLCCFTLLAQPDGKFGGGDAHSFSCSAAMNQTLLEVTISVDVDLFLQGAYNTGTGLMNTDLRNSGVLPNMEPYTDLGFALQNPGAVADALVFDAVGADAIVDWVVVELRNHLDATDIIAARAALLQADGDVVDIMGVSLTFLQAAGDYYIAVKHRNHLGVMTEEAIEVNAN